MLYVKLPLNKVWHIGEVQQMSAIVLVSIIVLFTPKRSVNQQERGFEGRGVSILNGEKLIKISGIR